MAKNFQTRRVLLMAALSGAALLFLPGAALPVAFPHGLVSPHRQSPAAPQAPAQKAKYVGAEACKTCHEDLYNQYKSAPHAKTLIAFAGDPAKTGCEACHGPGGNHVDNPGDPATIVSFKTAKPADINARCLSCHSTGHDQMSYTSSTHAQNHIACTDCHSSHHPATPQFLLKAPQPQLCYTCHIERRAEFNMPSHHKVNEGLVQCSDCHNAHGSAGPSQLRTAAAADAVCYTCHADKRGPFVYEHEPVKVDGCMACHSPHGSSNSHLLKFSSVNILCLQCHTASSFSGAPGTPSFHNMTAQYQSCLSCHTQIHGSNFNAYFFQ